ncbi:hypothetical protein FOCC_FOCC011460 [Frankliniella occidentalis]|nr:hypothetical protein FOCC_FOCC011460 [Frankliniella occidentalis]
MACREYVEDLTPCLSCTTLLGAGEGATPLQTLSCYEQDGLDAPRAARARGTLHPDRGLGPGGGAVLHEWVPTGRPCPLCPIMILVRFRLFPCLLQPPSYPRLSEPSARKLLYACLTTPARRCLPDDACPTMPPRRRVLDDACSTTPAPRRLINNACSSMPARRRLPNDACSSMPARRRPSNNACPTTPARRRLHVDDRRSTARLPFRPEPARPQEGPHSPHPAPAAPVGARRGPAEGPREHGGGPGARAARVDLPAQDGGHLRPHQKHRRGLQPNLGHAVRLPEPQGVHGALAVRARLHALGVGPRQPESYVRARVRAAPLSTRRPRALPLFQPRQRGHPHLPVARPTRGRRRALRPQGRRAHVGRRVGDARPAQTDVPGEAAAECSPRELRPVAGARTAAAARGHPGTPRL